MGLVQRQSGGSGEALASDFTIRARGSSPRGFSMRGNQDLIHSGCGYRGAAGTAVIKLQVRNEGDLG